MKNKYRVEGHLVIDNNIVFLIRDLKTNELLNITEDSFIDKNTKKELFIYKAVAHYFGYLSLMNSTFKDNYIKNVTKKLTI